MNARLESPPIIGALEALLGREHVLTAPAELEFYSTDVFRSGQLPCAVVRPGSTGEVQRVVTLAASHGIAVVPRGGGASYTDAYLPTERGSVAIDTSRLNRIVEINATDMYVVVESGVTWAALEAALRPTGLRPAFFGTFSGIAATVGGSMSQNSVSWGSGIFGVSADNVLALEVVLATGEIMRTGSWASANGAPFFRHYGPDLTGLFTGDAGALGIKTRISLRLLRRPEAFIGLSFKFPTFEAMAAGMAAAAQEGINTNNFGLDPALQQGQLGKAGGADAIKAALAVFRSARTPVDGAVQVARMAAAGKRFLSGECHSAHYIVEGIDQRVVRAHAGRLRDLLAPHGAEVANTIPAIVQAMPFAPLHNLLGPRGERWLPLHGVLPFSRVAAFRRDIEALYDRYAAQMQACKVTRGAMFMTIATHAFLYEPVFYWQDERNAFLERMVPADYLKTLPTYPANPAGRALVVEIKQAIIDLFHAHGAVHFQVGKAYPYLRDRDAALVRVLQGIKASVDPDRRLNPGALGL